MISIIEFFSGLVSTLLWVPLGVAAFGLQIIAPLVHFDTQGLTQPGIVFSIKQAESLGENPVEVYDTVLSDIHPRYLRLIAYWDRIEKQQGAFDFTEFDAYVAKAARDNVKLTLIVGRKVPRWPECHIPAWAASLDQQEQHKALDAYLDAFVAHYKDNPAVEMWQVENEPFLKFGNCQYDAEVEDVREEIARIHALDPAHPVLVTASGELDTWLRSFMTGDVVGVSTYRRFFIALPWVRVGLEYPLPPLFYRVKAALFQHTFWNKPLMITEMQLEPWLPVSLAQAPLDEQFGELPFTKFQQYIDYARRTGIEREYLWGVEWWYWLRMHGHAEFWNYVRDAVFTH